MGVGVAAGILTATFSTVPRAAAAQHPHSWYSAIVLHDHPQYYWRLDGQSYSRNLTGGEGTNLYYGDQLAPGQPGAIVGDRNTALDFYGAVPDKIWGSHAFADWTGTRTTAPGQQSFGLEIWVKPRYLDGNSRRIISRERPDGGYQLSARDEGISFSRYTHGRNGDQWDTVVGPPLSTSSWTYVVANYDADGVMRLYVNGRLVDSRASSLSLPSDQQDGTPRAGRFVLGASSRQWNPDNHSPSQAWIEWDGWLDEAAYYGGAGRTLSSKEVRQHWLLGGGAKGHHRPAE